MFEVIVMFLYVYVRSDAGLKTCRPASANLPRNHLECIPIPVFPPVEEYFSSQK